MVVFRHHFGTEAVAVAASADVDCGTRPEHMMLRRACVYINPDDWEIPVRATTDFGRYFANLFRNLGTVKNGFVEPVDYGVIANKNNYDPDTLYKNMIFGTPDEVIEKLEAYEKTGVDHYLYGACFGMPHDFTAQSLQLFCDEVMPHFKERGIKRSPQRD